MMAQESMNSVPDLQESAAPIEVPTKPLVAQINTEQPSIAISSKPSSPTSAPSSPMGSEQQLSQSSKKLTNTILQRSPHDAFTARPIAPFFESKKFADAVLALESGEEIQVHRILLAARSQLFAEIFDQPGEPCPKTSLPKYKLDVEDPLNAVPEVLTYFYRSSIAVNLENIIPILYAAEMLKIPDLISLTNLYIERELPAHCFEFLELAVAFNRQSLIPKIINAIAVHHGAELSTESQWTAICHLSLKDFQSLISHPNYMPHNESDKFVLVSHYVEKNLEGQSKKCLLKEFQEESDRKITDEERIQLFTQIKFSQMTVQQLEAAYANKLVPNDLVVAGLLEKLKTQSSSTEDSGLVKLLTMQRFV
ncbi:hypothetical protein BKA69DRAFT_691228 [Paraphysoderma sedebokerense]|nr:hypothetical protein BKA69DRAFT_691228 [Paraphysoderma sedebokerense]